MNCINFDEHFADFTAQWLKEHSKEYRNYEAMEEDMPRVYMTFLNTPAPWLDAYRAQYARQFRALAWRTLRRMDAVGADGPLELLCRRAAWAAPGDSALHGELIRCLAQYQRQVELIRHVAQLKLSRGKEQN